MWERRPGKNQGRGGKRDQSFRPDKGKNERIVVRKNVGDIVDFLQSKVEHWTADKLIYEFTGPNGHNWKLITESSSIDMEGKILREIFRLLSHPDIQHDPLATELYFPLSKDSSLKGMMTYVKTGFLGKDKIAHAVSAGRGEKQWINVVDDASCAVETIVSLMNKFSAVQSNDLVPLETISSRIEDLLGKNFAADRILEGWGDLIDNEVKTKYTNKSTNLQIRLNDIQRMHEASTAAKILVERACEEKKAGGGRNTIQRLEGGTNFADDHSRDTDFLMTSATPTAEDMTSSPPMALPQNHVEEQISTDCAASEENTTKPLPLYPYRSINHYLNTHFMLLREDCIAQI